MRWRVAGFGTDLRWLWRFLTQPLARIQRQNRLQEEEKPLAKGRW
jgi:hypothetical protein